MSVYIHVHVGCWLILCQVAELLATYQISKSDIRYLFLKLQKSPTHLVTGTSLKHTYVHKCILHTHMYIHVYYIHIRIGVTHVVLYETSVLFSYPLGAAVYDSP